MVKYITADICNFLIHHVDIVLLATAMVFHFGDEAVGDIFRINFGKEETGLFLAIMVATVFCIRILPKLFFI